MGVLKRRNKEAALDIAETSEKGVEKTYTPIDTSMVISTGSTLLDLAISGGRIRGGGVPGGIMMEISGPSSSGKTALITEMAASVQSKGGQVDFKDPESRLDKEYSRIYGMELDKEHYTRPDTVREAFEEIRDWDPVDHNCINMIACDSIAALSTDMEMEAEDKRGQRKAKELSEWTRKTARIIAQSHKLIVFTNQEKDGEYGKVTPGGKSVGFHSSLRTRIARKGKLEKKKKMPSGVIVSKVIGIESECTVFKSTVDDEWRTAPIYIVFGVGIDDVRANLQWYKDMTKSTKYLAVDKEYQAMDYAIQYIEDNNLEADLREMVIDLWEEIEAKFKMQRKKKVRF